MSEKNLNLLKLRNVGECAVIHVAPSWIFSVKVLAIHFNEENPGATIYDLDAAWCERCNNCVDYAHMTNPEEAPGLQARAGIQMSIADSWITMVWRAHSHITRDINPTR